SDVCSSDLHLNEENPEQKLEADDLGEKETSKSHQEFTVKDENEGENLSDEDQKEEKDEVKAEDNFEEKNPKEEVSEDDSIEDFFRPDPLDRMDKANRRYENQGGKASPYNQRSVIEEVQAKVYRNNAKKKRDEDYYIEDYKSYILNENLEQKLDKLIGDGDNDLPSMTLSAGIRKIQARNKKIGREEVNKDDGDQILRNANPKTKPPAVREVDKKEKAKEKAKKKSKDPRERKYLTSRNLLL